MNNDVSELQQKIRHFIKINTNNLDKSEELKEGYGFKTIRNRSDFIISTLQHIDFENLQYIESENAQALVRILDRLLNCFSEIDRLNMHSGDLAQLKAAIEDRFNSAFFEFQKSIKQHLFLYSKYNCLDEAVLEYVKNPGKMKLRIELINQELERVRKNLGSTEQEAANFSSNFNSEKKSLRDDLETYKASTNERLKLNSVAVLWSQREQSYQNWHKGFSVGLVIIFTCFLIAIWASINFNIIENISQLLAPPPVNGVTNWPEFLSYTLPRFIIFSLPVAGTIWFLRILLRLYLTNLAMLEDAKQRKTILDTYFSLIEDDPNAEKERHLLLNAMFRPLPGEPNDIEPPNLSELMALGKK
jgi:hypothetical protein